MTRIEALEKMAEAARALSNTAETHPWYVDRHADLLVALQNLDALPAPAVETGGEVVEVRAGVYYNRETETFSVSGVRWADGNCSVAPSSELIATIRARVPLPRIPELVGEVKG